MADLNYYILSSNSEQQRLLFICKLVEKIYRSGQKIYILTVSEAQSRKLDDLLWSFRSGSFIPHQIFSGNSPFEETPVLIGMANAPAGWQNALINLSEKLPDNIQQYQRILEILDDNEEIKQSGRKRYRDYQSQGCRIKIHNL